MGFEQKTQPLKGWVQIYEIRIFLILRAEHPTLEPLRLEGWSCGKRDEVTALTESANT
jgi:hypothetical protein